MAFVAITRVQLKSVWNVPQFLWHAILSRRQVVKAGGMLKVDAFNLGLVFCTRSVWKDAASMRAFMLSGAHRKAMPVLRKIAVVTTTDHWEQEAVEMPSRAEVEQRLRAKLG